MTGILRRLLGQALRSAYNKEKLPCKLDEQICEALADHDQLDQQKLYAVADEISGDIANVLGLFAERMASLAITEQNRLRIEKGLLALLVYSYSVDAREVILVLSLLHDATKRIGESPRELFGKLSSVTDDAGFFEDFLDRNPNDQSIEAMGYEYVTTDEGFHYRRTW